MRLGLIHRRLSLVSLREGVMRKRVLRLACACAWGRVQERLQSSMAPQELPAMCNNSLSGRFHEWDLLLAKQTGGLAGRRGAWEELRLRKWKAVERKYLSSTLWNLWLHSLRVWAWHSQVVLCEKLWVKSPWAAYLTLSGFENGIFHLLQATLFSCLPSFKRGRNPLILARSVLSITERLAWPVDPRSITASQPCTMLCRALSSALEPPASWLLCQGYPQCTKTALIANAFC